MNSIALTLSCSTDQDRSVLTMTVTDKQWEGATPSRLFAEVGENLIKSSFQNFRFDLSRLGLVSSVTFGACANIIAAANKNKKTIELVLNREAAETARIASLDKMIKIIEV